MAQKNLNNKFDGCRFTQALGKLPIDAQEAVINDPEVVKAIESCKDLEPAEKCGQEFLDQIDVNRRKFW